MLNRHFKGHQITLISVIADHTGQQQDLFAKYPVDNKSILCYRCFDYLGSIQGNSLQLSRDIYFFCGKCSSATSTTNDHE